MGLQLLREDIRGNHGLSAADALTKVELLLREVQHVQRIVQDFVRLTQEPELQLRDRDPHALVEEVLAFLAPDLAEKGIRVCTQLDRTLTSIRVDPDLLRQVLVQLVRNAEQAMPSGGVLTFLTHSEPERLTIHIIDTGAGIPAEIRDRIFDGFFSTKPDRAGMGLAVARQIIERHGGSIACDSAEGLGTRFTVALPTSGGPIA